MNDIGKPFGHTGGYCADSVFGNEFDGNLGLRVDLFEVEDKLSEVLNAVDVVVGWGRDESDAGVGHPNPGDLVGHFMAWNLAALTGLGSLSHLDLNLFGTG